MRPDMRERLANLPDAPGVYLMKNKAGEVFYVGKAQSLRDRVRSYFSGSDTRAFVALLDTLLADLEVVLTNSNKEAMLLENELIKQHKPRFNVKLTDDKRFLCLKLNTHQTYPRLEVVRRFAKDKARYFGPYHSAASIRETLRIVNRYFQLRTCTDQVMHNRRRPCLQYQIKRCPAPCVFDLSDGTYRDNVQHVTAFLEGRTGELIDTLTQRMTERATNMDFEGAAVLRDQIAAVNRSMERQRLISTDMISRDIVGMYREGPAVEIHVMRTRAGRLIDARRFSFADTEVPTAEVLADFAGRYYTDSDDVPDEILFPEQMEWAEALSTVLSDSRRRQVRVYAPQRGDKKALVQLAQRNARQAFVDKQREAGAARNAIDRLQRALHLKKAPNTLECFDISHLQGNQIVASAVRFSLGKPDKAKYRHYKIRSTLGQDDFQSMYEVLSRRARRALEANDMPDLLVIDGGKGQLAAARAALDDHGIHGVDLVSLAKSRLLTDVKLERADRRAAALSDQVADAGMLELQNAETAEVKEPPTRTAEPEVPAGEAEVFAGEDDDAGMAQALASQGLGGVQSVAGEARAPRSLERVFVSGHKNPIVLRQNSAELFILTRARDEAHRFAITFHRKLRQKAATHSSLDDIVGVGPKRRRALLRAFGSLARLRAASAAQIAQVVGPKLAQQVHQSLHKDDTSP